MKIDWEFIPSHGQFIERVFNDLALHYRSTILVLPSSVDTRVVMRPLEKILTEYDFEITRIFLPDLTGELNPLIQLSIFLFPDEDGVRLPKNIEDLVHYDNLPEILIFKGFDKLTQEKMDLWVNFILDWIRSSKYLSDAGLHLPRLCVPVSTEYMVKKIPQNDTYLAFHWWVGIPSILEMRIQCRLNSEGEHNAMTSWREFIIPSVASGNLSFAEYLWDKIDNPIDKQIELIYEYWKINYSNEPLTELPSLSAYEDRSEPLEISTILLTEILPLWASGLVSITPEFNIELSAFALVRFNEIQRIKHYFWRGQAELLLPIINKLRLEICQYINARYGFDNLLRDCKSITNLSDFLGYEWGELEKLLRCQSDIIDEEYLLQAVSKAREIRNKIAHYQTIEFKIFEEFLSIIKKLKQDMRHYEV